MNSSVKLSVAKLAFYGALVVALACVAQASAVEPATTPYSAWKHSGSMFILTTPDGAKMPDGVVVHEFPLLVHFHRDWFDFEAAQPDGADLRFATADGKPLPYEIDEWDPKAGEAAVWVRVPEIRGNARQGLRVFWGNAKAASESDGAKVFNASNGYVSVWHMNGDPRDTVGTVESKDVGTTPSPGMVGRARHFAGKQGVFCGDKITGYPSGLEEHSTQLWFRAEKCSNTLIAWGNEEGGRGSKVRMLFRGPKVIRIDSNFSDVWTNDRLALDEWTHVTHTYTKDDGKIYIDGKLKGEAKPTLKIASPAKLWLGGWYNNYDFVGDLDEVRISNKARSAEWIELEHENQRTNQMLVGPIVQPGDEFSLSATEIEINEGESYEITAKAGGAQKLRWSPGGCVTYAVDRLTYRRQTKSVEVDDVTELKLHASYPDGIRTKTVKVRVKNKFSGPKFELKAPETWDGRTRLELVPDFHDPAVLNPTPFGKLRYLWKVTGPAVVKEELPGKLVLERALGPGPIAIEAGIWNDYGSGYGIAMIDIAKPAVEGPRLERKPNADERPADGQFYARNEKDFGTLVYNGTLAAPDDANAENVFLRVFAGDERIANETRKLGADKKYAFAVPLKAGLIKYRAEFGTTDKAGAEKLLHTAGDLVCGDAFIIIGQSNAVATDFGKDAEAPPINEWVRTFGATEGGPTGSRLKLWAPAQARNRGGVSEIGYWGMVLGRRLVESQKVPICFINGAVGGTRVDQHQRNMTDPTDVTTIYGRLLWRVREAKLTHGIRGIIWHQGENDQGADGPSGDFGHVRYREYFQELTASWQRDYPNVQHRYVFQIWPKSCAMGINGSDNELREVQRTLGLGVANLSVLSTLGIKPPGGCHYPAAGYAEFARMLAPLIERDLYGKKFAEPITPPNLVRARFTSAAHDTLELEFDQPVVWHDKLVSQFLIHHDFAHIKGDPVQSGSAKGNIVTLRFAGPAKAWTVSYLDSKAWSQDNLLVGTNGLAALTFWGVRIEQ